MFSVLKKKPYPYRSASDQPKSGKAEASSNLQAGDRGLNGPSRFRKRLAGRPGLGKRRFPAPANDRMPPENAYIKGAKSIGFSLSLLALGLSLVIHGSVIYLIFFGFPAWMKLFPACLSSCFTCSGSCSPDQGFLSRLTGLPQCLAVCLKTSVAQQPMSAAPPEQVVTVEVFEEVPVMPEAQPQPPTNLPSPDLYNLKGNATAANDPNEGEEAAAGQPPASAPEGHDLAALSPAELGRPHPEADSDALALKKKTPPPKVVPPEVKTGPAETKPANKSKSEVMPLHEILTRSLGRDAAGRMLGSSRGTEDDPVMRRYLDNARVRLDGNWRKSMDISRGFQASYEIVIEPNGLISSFRLLRSTGDASFNRSVETAIRKTSPLSPLPSSYGRRSLRVAFTFSDRRS